MEMVSPSGPMYQAGTLSGNPLAMAAGYEMLRTLSTQKSVYNNLEKLSASLEIGVKDCLQKLGLGYQFNRVGSMFTLFFTEQAVVDFDSAKTSDTQKFSLFFQKMLEGGIYLPPSQFEAGFISHAHSSDDIEATLTMFQRAFI